MLCDRCHKREACVHIQEVRPEGKRSLNLCSFCALEQYSDKDKKLQEFLGVLTAISRQLGEPGESASDASRPELSCPSCGKRLSELAKNWVLGCESCVSAFREPLREHVAKVQRLTLSVGDGPRPGEGLASDDSAALSCLRRDLKLAIQREDYEAAARLRDRIETLLHPVRDIGQGS